MQPQTLIEPLRALFHAPLHLAEAEGFSGREGIARRMAAGSTDAAAAARRLADVPEANRLRAVAPGFPHDAFGRLGAAMPAPGAIGHGPPFEDCLDEAIVADAPA